MKRAMCSLGAMMFLGLICGCASTKDIRGARATLENLMNKERRDGAIAAVGEGTPQDCASQSGEDCKAPTQTQKWILACDAAQRRAKNSMVTELFGEWTRSEDFVGLTQVEQLRREGCAKHFISGLRASQSINVDLDSACASLIVMDEAKYKDLKKYLKAGTGAGYVQTTDCSKLPGAELK